MATFELIEDGTYRVEGEITQEDVDRINAFQIRTCLVLTNTKGQSSEIIGQITSDNVYFSILGGLDYYNKEKFNNSNYIERTQSAPKGLTKILQYFERIESGINPEWTDTQKCMYAYNALAVDTDYVTDLEQDILSSGVTERGLNGVLYNQLTCAGMAQTFKEMMDRLDIPCHYQNQRRVHAFNVVELEGKLRGIDVTWDCTKRDEEKCSFKNFGRDPNFYEKYGHQISGDSEETVFDLTTFTDEEIQENYEVIESAINQRRKIVHPFRNFDRDRKKKFLPVDKFMESLEDEKTAITKLRLMKQMGTLPEEMSEVVDAISSRYGFINDYIGTNHGTVDLRRILEEIGQSNNLGGNLIIKDGQFLLVTHDGGERKEAPLTQEQQETITPSLLADVKEYYTQYFETEAPQIDNLLEAYTTIESMPPELAQKTATLRVQLYTKIRLFANGDKFFEQLGIPKEEVEEVSKKANNYLESTREVADNSKPKHENDLDFLYAIVQNDVIDTLVAGREYTEEDLAKLMADVRENWKDAEFSDDEFKMLLDDALDKSIGREEISGGTVNSRIGLEETNEITSEIRTSYTRDSQKTQETEGFDFDWD